MPLNEDQKKAIIDDLVANCPAWQGKGDREILAGLPEDKLKHLSEASQKDRQLKEVANAAASGFRVGNSEFRVNPESGKWERRPVEGAADPVQQAPAPAANSEKPDLTQPRKRPQTREEIERTLPADLQAELQQARRLVNQQKEEVISQLLVNVNPADREAHAERLRKRELDDLRYDLDIMPKSAPAASEKTVSNQKRSPQAAPKADGDTLDRPKWDWSSADDEPTPADATANAGFEGGTFSETDWLKGAPIEVRARWNQIVALEEDQKRKLIDQITANVYDEDQEKRIRTRLAGKTLEELQDLLSLAPPREAPKTNYFGASAAPPPSATGNSRQQYDVNEDILPLPDWNWRDDKRNKA